MLHTLPQLSLLLLMNQKASVLNFHDNYSARRLCVQSSDKFFLLINVWLQLFLKLELELRCYGPDHLEPRCSIIPSLAIGIP